MSATNQVLGFCSWCDSWYDRATGKPVQHDEKPVSHGVCPSCADAAIEEAKRIKKQKTI